jgi:hypothetical protein
MKKSIILSRILLTGDITFSAADFNPSNFFSKLPSATPLFSCSAFLLSKAAVSSSAFFLPTNIAAIEDTDAAILVILSSTFDVELPGSLAPIFSPLILVL